MTSATATLRARVLGAGFVLSTVLACASPSAEPPVAQSDEEQAQANRDAWVAPDKVGAWYQRDCAVCHGASLEGAAQGPSLLTPELRGGGSVDEIAATIARGVPQKNMPAWQGVLSDAEIRGLAIYLVERREEARRGGPVGLRKPLVVPEGVVRSERHAFRVKVVREGIEHPYSIAPLPDGRILVTEKARGLSVLSADGGSVTRVEGTPPVFDDGEFRGDQFTGNGWFHDVELHPEFERNGWIYLSHGDRCNGCNAESRESGDPVSMIRLVRGRLQGHRWVDTQVIWQADRSAYQTSHEIGTGARIAFDDRGHVFLSLGVMVDYSRIQDLSMPDGKVHRVRDDGSVPKDNPFVGKEGALPSIWTLGHRNPQGLGFDRSTRTLWSTEHGPRGGDEANLLRPGHNYGWPMVSLGVDYDGLPVKYAKLYGIDYDPEELTGPAIDWTPSPGVSSLVFYRGEAFPEWSDQMLVATLNGNQLIRVETSAAGAGHQERVIEELGRIRDVEVGPRGRVFLLVEHADGSVLLRMDPAGAGKGR